MDFLKAIFGEKPLTFDEFARAIDAHNGNEANKDNQIKLGNLGGGEYVGKAKYDALQTLLDGKTTELDTANTLIADLKKGTKGNEELQGKVTAYETQVSQLQEQLKQTQIDSELKVAMLAAGAKADDIDYLMYRLNNTGEKLELGEDGHIKGIDEKIETLKTQHPSQFDAKTTVKVEPNRLPDPNNTTGGLTKAELLNKPYAERQKLFEENPEAYKAAMNS